jgi:phosphatidylglycerophosphate synthase
MFDSRLRLAKDRALAPVAASLRSVPPVALTAIGLAAGLGCAAAAHSGDTPLALGLWVANRTLDGLDGTVERLAGTSSDRGGYLDLVADFITYAAIPVAQVAGASDRAALAVPLGALLGAYYVNAVSWLALSAILERRGAAGRGAGQTPFPPPLRDTLARDRRGLDGGRARMPADPTWDSGRPTSPTHAGQSVTGTAPRGAQTTIAMPVGLVEGTETVVFVLACLALPHLLAPLFLGFAVLVVLTALERVVWAWRALGPE